MGTGAAKVDSKAKKQEEAGQRRGETSGAASPTAPSAMSVVSGSFREAGSAWRNILTVSSEARTLCASQMALWAALSGAQMTLLPLFLADHFAMTPTTIGYAFAGMATVGIFCAQPLARMADEWGRGKAMTCGFAALGSAIILAPHSPSWFALGASLALWSLGNNVVGPSVMAQMTDAMSSDPKCGGAAGIAQGLSLLRTAGDVGILLGASSIGAYATYAGMIPAFHASGALLAAATVGGVVREIRKMHQVSR